MAILARWRRGESGFSLIELMLVVGIAGVVTAMAVVQIGSSRQAYKGDAAMRVVLAQFNQARELAITQRRFIRLTFDTTANQLSVVREDTTATTTTLAVLGFEGGAKFTLMTGVPDTPDAFGRTAATSFTSSNGTFPSATGSTNVVKFSPDGTLVDWNGRAANGTIFTGITGTTTSARAVTILGSTGRVRGYRWNGTAWVTV